VKHLFSSQAAAAAGMFLVIYFREQECDATKFCLRFEGNQNYLFMLLKRDLDIERDGESLRPV
jgi:hypothetical protein